MSSLRWKLFVSYLLVCFVPLIFYANTISKSLESFFSADKSTELKRYGNYAALTITQSQVLVDQAVYERDKVRIKNDLISRCENWNINRILVISAQSFIVIDTSGIMEGMLYIPPDVRSALIDQSSISLSADKSRMFAAIPIYNEGADEKYVIGVVLIISDIGEINFMLDEIAQKLILIALLLSLIVLVLVFFISQLLIDPLKSILNVVKKMSEGHLHQRILLTGHDEFAEVGAAFNDMSEQLEKVEMTRQEFVSNVSHELKTPLSSMKVLSQSLLLEDDVPNEMYKEFLQDITNEVDRMAEIITELLTLVKLDQMELPLNIQQISVTKMLEDVMKRLSPLASQKDISLHYEETAPFIIAADEMKLSLAFSNLVENGIKYTPNDGEVKLLVDGDHQNVFVTVMDDGIGIDESEHSKVFTRFYRVDKTRDRETGGTGLGLAITHKIILLHDGGIKLFSKENEGASFVVRLPIYGKDS